MRANLCILRMLEDTFSLDAVQVLDCYAVRMLDISHEISSMRTVYIVAVNSSSCSYKSSDGRNDSFMAYANSKGPDQTAKAHNRKSSLLRIDYIVSNDFECEQRSPDQLAQTDRAFAIRKLSPDFINLFN